MRKEPTLKGRIICSGIVLGVDKIREDGTIKLENGYEGDINTIELLDNLDYDAMRPQFAGQAMQAMLCGACSNTLLMEQMCARAQREGYNSLSTLIAHDAANYADDLIAALKKPRKLNPLDYQSKV